MSQNKRNNYLIVDKRILPDYYEKVLAAQEMLRTGAVKEVSEAARQAGIRLAALSSYYMADSASCPPGTLVLGYGALEDGLCPSLAATLKKACTAASDSWSRV